MIHCTRWLTRVRTSCIFSYAYIKWQCVHAGNATLAAVLQPQSHKRLLRSTTATPRLPRLVFEPSRAASHFARCQRQMPLQQLTLYTLICQQTHPSHPSRANAAMVRRARIPPAATWWFSLTGHHITLDIRE